MQRARGAALAGLILLVLFLAAPSSGQTPPVFEAALDMVHVTVTVLDAKGEVVDDLTADDFVISEDGRPQKLLVFGRAAADEADTPPAQREDLALNLGMLFDTSTSMREELRLSQESAIRFLDAIPRAEDLLLVFFDQDIRISRYNSENQQGIFGRILETEGEGNTALNDAIAVYLSRVANVPGRKVLVLFTDGDDSTSRTTMTEVLDMMRASDVVVYPVAFPPDRPASQEARRARAFLVGLASQSGGRVFEPSASRELAAIYRSILGELGSQYVLGFVSDRPDAKQRYRKLRVEVKRKGLRVRHRKGYEVAGR